MGPDQAFGARPAGTAEGGISGAVRGEPGRPGQRRTGRGRALHLHSARHATHHDNHLAGRVRDPAQNHLRQFREPHAAPHLHGRTQLSHQRGAVIHGLLDRSMARYRRRWPVRQTRGRDPQSQRTSHLRDHRPSDAQGQPDHREGAHCPRQKQSRHAAQRDHDHRQCADPPLDRDQEVSSRAQLYLVREHLRRRQCTRRHRQGELHAERGRLVDAGAQEPGAAGSEIFPAALIADQEKLFNSGDDDRLELTNGGLEENAMLDRNSIAFVAMVSMLGAAMSGAWTDARAWDDALYPDLKGQWRVVGGPMRFDPSKPWGPGQEAPLTPEYQAIFEVNLKAQAVGGQGTTPTYTCLSPGMPRVTNGYGQIEFVVTPETTHVLVQHIHDNRRIFTDGRTWPADVEPSFLGYSVGKWIDTDGDGRYDQLEVETRQLKGPRAFDSSGIPLHNDNQTIVKERIFLDRADRDLLHNQVTVTDNALTRPWTVSKRYRREPDRQPFWREVNCAENNNHVEIGKENYMLSADGLLMPTRKDQPPPDLRYFAQSK